MGLNAFFPMISSANNTTNIHNNSHNTTNKSGLVLAEWCGSTPVNPVFPVLPHLSQQNPSPP